MSSETVTVYIAGVLPGHKSFDAPIVAEAQAKMTAKQVVTINADQSFQSLAGWRKTFRRGELSTTRLEAVERYLKRCEAIVTADATKLGRSRQIRDAAAALLDYEMANPQ